MSNVNVTRYVLAVQDIDTSKEYYINELGFTLMESPLGWAFLKRDSFILMLGESKKSLSAKQLGDHSYFAYINISDAQELYSEFTPKAVKVIKPLITEPWGMKEFAIETVDGHRIMFGEEI